MDQNVKKSTYYSQDFTVVVIKSSYCWLVDFPTTKQNDENKLTYVRNHGISRRSEANNNNLKTPWDAVTSERLFCFGAYSGCGRCRNFPERGGGRGWQSHLFLAMVWSLWVVKLDSIALKYVSLIVGTWKVLPSVETPLGLQREYHWINKA